MVRDGFPRVCFYFCPTERSSELFSLPLKTSEGNFESLLLFWFTERNSSCFLFRWKVWKGIPRVCFYFCSTERNSELFSLLQKGSERNSESFMFRETAGIPSEITICSVCSVFSAELYFVGNSQPYFWPIQALKGKKEKIGNFSFHLAHHLARKTKFSSFSTWDHEMNTPA